MNQIGPGQAALIADEVYAVRDADISKALKFSSSGLGLGNDFKVAEGGRFQGSSGPLVFRTETGFGYVAEGLGKRQGELLLAIRGTVPGLQDIATDLNIGMQIGPSGWPVHAGFNDTFRSLLPAVRSHLQGRSPSCIHCVGHSLGGALATLMADYLSESRIAEVALYTFGSPRVGALGFAGNLTAKLGSYNINRVYHNADPISMIPLFPFAHVPTDTRDVLLSWNGGLIAPAAHSMKNYIHSLGDAEWGSLRSPAEAVDWEARAKNWLETSSQGGVLMFSASVLWLITRALLWVVKKILAGVVGTALTVSATLLDQLAWLLRQGVRLGKEIGGYVKTILARIMQFLGRTTVRVEEGSVIFIRWALSMLFSSMQAVASRAIQLFAS
jgi:triacylglycerol lipase